MLPERKPVSLKMVAEHVGLAPCSVSAILNNTEASRAIPQVTKERVYRAATELNYRPNLWARSLRTKETRTVAVIVPDLGRAAVAKVVAAAQRRLHRDGYMLVLITSDFEDANRLSIQLQQRGIEGVISILADIPPQLDLPVTGLSDGMGAWDGLAEDMNTPFLELGTSAAESVIRQIANPETPQRVKIGFKMPAAFFDLRPAGLAYISSGESA